MVNYFFLYHTIGGSIYSAPYLGHADEWTNIPDDCAVLGPIPQGDPDAEKAFHNPAHYTVQNGTLVKTVTDAQLLTEAKRAKIAQLQAAAANALETVVSSALGAPHTYLTGYGKGNTDFIMLKAENDYMQSVDWDGLNILWYTVEAGDVEHTKAQIHQVWLDARGSGQAAKFKAKNLIEQAAVVELGTGTLQAALDAINAIVW